MQLHRERSFRRGRAELHVQLQRPNRLGGAYSTDLQVHQQYVHCELRPIPFVRSLTRTHTHAHTHAWMRAKHIHTYPHPHARTRGCAPSTCIHPPTHTGTGGCALRKMLMLLQCARRPLQQRGTRSQNRAEQKAKISAEKACRGGMFGAKSIFAPAILTRAHLFRFLTSHCSADTPLTHPYSTLLAQGTETAG